MLKMLPNTLNAFCHEPSIFGKDQSLTTVKRHPETPCIRQQVGLSEIIISTKTVYKYLLSKKRGLLKKIISMCAMLVIGQGILFQTALAHDMGAQGVCFSIQEEDMKSFMIRQMQKKNIQKIVQHAFKKSMTQSFVQKRKSYLPRAVTSRTYFVDPTQTIDQQMIPNSPKQINPFDQVTFNKTLIFVDANDLDQLNWLEKGLTKWKKNKVILVGGSLVKTQKTLGQQVFVDQTGELADYFHLKHVPVVIKENIEKKQWEVKEIKINNDSSSLHCHMNTEEEQNENVNVNLDI